MFCKYCGSEIADDSVFCSKCGRNLAEKGPAEKTPAGKEPAEIKQIEKKPTEEKAEPVHPIEEPETEEHHGKALFTAVKKEDIKEDHTEWFVFDGMISSGPYSYEEMERMVKNGAVLYTSKVRKNRNDPWIPLTESAFGELVIGKGTTEVSVSDTWVWCLAIVPILLTAALTYFGIISKDGAGTWFIPLAVNVIFMILDKKELEAKKFQPESWMWMGYVLIPVYLIVREVKTNRNFVPAIIWLFLFAVDVFVL